MVSIKALQTYNSCLFILKELSNYSLLPEPGSECKQLRPISGNLPINIYLPMNLKSQRLVVHSTIDHFN